MPLTLNDATDDFDQTPCDKSAADLLTTAAEYHGYGMIADGTFRTIVKRVAEWLKDE